ncbi:hypothetical protein FRB93_011844 [Tulasnella sp. JGI-2019a]|nr:hypothetical protein FRB93_011844 [Tulasnella sp. JGI-2019a]
MSQTQSFLSSSSVVTYLVEKLARMDLPRIGDLPVTAAPSNNQALLLSKSAVLPSLPYEPMDALGYAKTIHPGRVFHMLEGPLERFDPFSIWRADSPFKVRNFEGHVVVWDRSVDETPREVFFRYSELVDTGEISLMAYSQVLLGSHGVPAIAEAMQLFVLDTRATDSSRAFQQAQTGTGASVIFQAICPSTFAVKEGSRWIITWRLKAGTSVEVNRARILNSIP